MHDKKTIMSKNINVILNSLLISIDSFIIFLKKENKLLLQGDVNNAAKMLDKKYEILVNFQKIESDLHSSLQEHDIINDQQAKEMFEKAKIKYNSLHDLMQENEILLRSNIEIGEKIMEIYNSSRVNQLVNQYGYNKDGQIAAAQNLEKIMPAININNKI
jgi:DNA-directed RNA polymerase subunit H (RpoH/RPB5)